MKMTIDTSDYAEYEGLTDLIFDKLTDILEDTSYECNKAIYADIIASRIKFNDKLPHHITHDYEDELHDGVQTYRSLWSEYKDSSIISEIFYDIITEDITSSQVRLWNSVTSQFVEDI